MKGRTGRRELTCLVVPAAHDELDHLLAIECILVAHDAQRGQAPVNGVHTQVRGEMVHQVILALGRGEAVGIRMTACTHLSERLNVFDVQGDQQFGC